MQFGDDSETNPQRYWKPHAAWLYKMTLIGINLFWFSVFFVGFRFVSTFLYNTNIDIGYSLVPDHNIDCIKHKPLLELALWSQTRQQYAAYVLLKCNP